ncbi:DUF397 domain-containing protein [Streptomyces sp. NPDC059743]|uniref:DUF397 domain-containing protein n=1 Tax=Streptomyces sp. NPDC059743 TaxID=3346928 RepID=UPI003647B58D
MSSTDLYALSTEGATFTAMCGGNGGDADNDESCLTVAEIPGAQDAYALGDTKKADVAGVIRMSGAELDRFAVRWVARRGLSL